MHAFVKMNDFKNLDIFGAATGLMALTTYMALDMLE